MRPAKILHKIDPILVTETGVFVIETDEYHLNFLRQKFARA
jgi:hypothetical protein